MIGCAFDNENLMAKLITIKCAFTVYRNQTRDCVLILYLKFTFAITYEALGLSTWFLKSFIS